MNTFTRKIAGLFPDKIRITAKQQVQYSLFSALAAVSGSKHKALLWSYSNFKLTSYEILLRGYFQGVVPLPSMSDTSRIEWHDPEFRGIVPIEQFKATRTLMQLLKRNKNCPDEQKFEVKINHDFKKTIESCALPRRKTRRTWISPEYIDAALELHELGIANSVEVYQNKELVGGIIGYGINGYFADISLFNTVDNASKFGYYYLLLKLKEAGFTLHDSGWADTWFTQFGMINMPREEFRKSLARAMITQVKFDNSIPSLPF